jgi:hypothetical protein
MQKLRVNTSIVSICTGIDESLGVVNIRLDCGPELIIAESI